MAKELVLILKIKNDEDFNSAVAIENGLVDLLGRRWIGTGTCVDTGEREIFIPLAGKISAKIYEPDYARA